MAPTADAPTDTSDSHARSNHGRPARSITRRTALKAGGGATLLSGLAGCIGGLGGGGGTFTLGVNLPFSQGWKPYGQPVLNAARIAIDDINADGGLAGQEIEVVVEDSQAAPQTAVEKTNKLIQEDGVDLILGPLTSASRNAVSPILSRNEVPALYVIDYEGPAGEDYCNEWLFKFGETPPQQVDPLIPWLMDNHGSSFYLIGQDYIWPQTMNELVREQVSARDGTVLDEQYVQFGTTDFSSIIPRIEDADPDVLFMTVTGESAINLQKQMGNRGIRDSFQDVGLGHIQPVLAGIPSDAVDGLLNCRDYFESLDNDANQEFLSRYYDEFGDDAPMSTHAGLGYTAMRMLKTALDEQGEASADAILEGLPGTAIGSPMGDRSMEHDHQLNHGCTVAEVGEDKKFAPVTTFDTVMPDETCDGF